VIDVTKIIAERKKFLSDLKPAVRRADKETNDLTRELKRLLARKNALPDEKDLLRITKFLQEIEKELQEVAKLISRGYIQ